MTFTRRLGFESLESRRMLTAVDIPDDLTGHILEQVSTPTNVDNATGIRAAEIRVAYDTTVLDIAEADISAGTVWAGDATADVVASVDEAAGTIVVSIFGAESLPAISGSLVNFRFTIRAGATVGSSTVIDLTEVRINEGAIVLDTNPQPGPDATDGRITVTEDGGTPSDNAMASGTVYADVNSNSQPDSTEGLPGVTVTLVNTTTNAEVQTTTQSNGRYQFTDLTPGSYRIQERQPAAYIDGGANEISVQLVSGQNLTDQNFRELGLRPEFIYNRLYTTLVMPIGSSKWVAAITQINADAENGIVNATIVAATTSVPHAEGEAPAIVISQTASPVVVPASSLTAEGEATAVPPTTASVLSTPMVSTAVAFPVVNLEPSVVTISPSPARNGATPKSEPSAASVEPVWSEDTTTLHTPQDTEAASGKKPGELADEFLVIDEAFAVTDSW